MYRRASNSGSIGVSQLRLECYILTLSVATPLSGRPLAVLGVNCRHMLLYNLGLQQLYAGHPMAAFDSLLEVVQVYHTNPRLWLRLSEACIAAHTQVVLTAGDDA